MGNPEKEYTDIVFNLGFLEIISSPHKGVIREVFLANHLAATDN